jgi:hypothetical protein
MGIQIRGSVVSATRWLNTLVEYILSINLCYHVYFLNIILSLMRVAQ